MHVRVEPALDPTLAFSVDVPDGWRRADGRHAELCRLGLPVPLAVFEAPQGSDGLAVATSTRLPFEVDVEDWCRFRCASTNWHVVASRAIHSAGGVAHELLAQRGAHLHRRDVVVLDAGRLVGAHVIASGPAWASGFAALETVGSSFRLLGATGHALAEPRMSWRVGSAAVRIELPASWPVRMNVDPAATSLDAELNTEGRQRGWLRVAARARGAAPTSIERRQMALGTALTQRGFVLDRHAANDRPRAGVLLGIGGWRGGGVMDALGPERVPWEIRKWHRDIDGWELDFLLAVAWHAERQLDWMRGVRALEIAVSSARGDRRR